MKISKPLWVCSSVLRLICNSPKTKADATSDTNLQERAEKDLLNIIYQQIEAEKKFQATKEEQAKAAAKMAAEEQGRVDRMKVLMKTVLDSMQLFTKQGPRDVVDRNKQADTRSAMAELREVVARRSKVGNGRSSGFRLAPTSG